MLGRALPGIESTVWFSLLPLALIVAALARGWACAGALLLSVALGGAGWLALRVHERPADALSHLLGSDPLGEPVVLGVRGLMLDDPEEADAPRGTLARFAPTSASAVFRVRVRSVELPGGLAGTSGVLWVRVGAPAQSVRERWRAGDRVRLLGRVEGVRPALNPGEPDRMAWGVQSGVVGRMTVESPELIGSDDSGAGLDRVRGVLLRVQGALAARAAGAIRGDPEAGPENRRAHALLEALLLGERDPGSVELDAAFTRLGLVHVVAISGFNLAVLSGVVVLLVRLVGDHGRLQGVIVAGVVLLYMLVLPAEAPVLRAGVMVLVLLACEASGRRYDRISTLGWIGFVLLVVRPLDAWSLGFQLSFGIVLALLWIGDRASERLFGTPIRGIVTFAPGGPGVGPDAPGVVRKRGGEAWAVIGRVVRANLSASLLAWGVATPLIAHHTGLVSPLAPLASLLVLPLVVVVLCVGYVTLLVGVISPWASDGVGFVADGLARVLVDVVLLIDEQAWMTVRLAPVSGAWVVVATGVVVYWFVRGHARSGVAWGLSAAALVWFAGEVSLGTAWRSDGALRIDALAMGQGGATLIRSGGEGVLWDCGSSNTGVGLRTIPAAVRVLGARRVPVVIVSSPRLDRYSGLPDVVEPLGVRTVLVPPGLVAQARVRADSAAAGLLDALRARGVEVREIAAGDRVRVGDAEAEVLWPARESVPEGPGAGSLVLCVRVGTGAGARSVLLTGDAGPGVLARVLAERADVRADVIEWPRRVGESPATRVMMERNPGAAVVVMDAPGVVRRRGLSGVPAGAVVTARDGAAVVRVLEDGRVEVSSVRGVGRGW